MQLFFTYPAKAYLLPIPHRKPREASFMDRKFIVWDNANVFAKLSGEVMPRVGVGEEKGRNAYFIEISVNGIFAAASGATSDAEFNERLGSIGSEGVTRWVEDQHAILLDMEGYAARKKSEIEARTAENQARTAEREARRLANEAEKREKARADFKAGEKIAFEQFEALCKEFGVIMPIRTIGSARKSVTAIGIGTMTVCGKSRPDMALKAAKELFQLMNAR